LQTQEGISLQLEAGRHVANAGFREQVGVHVSGSNPTTCLYRISESQNPREIVTRGDGVAKHTVLVLTHELTSLDGG
jgi:hypothetical protein